jgi:hypothetical protein
MNETLIVLILVVAAVAIFMFYPRNKREGYGFVMGALGQYKQLYYRCISECEREDKSNILGNGANINCDTYCNSKVTEMARRGGPSDPYHPHTEPPKVKLTVDECYEQCGEGKIARGCRSKCACEKEVDEKCRQECMHSIMPEGMCMDICSKTLKANCSSLSWTWK